MAVLRFAYAGTGDSAGGLDDPGAADRLAGQHRRGRVVRPTRHRRAGGAARDADGRPAGHRGGRPGHRRSTTWSRGTRAPRAASSSGSSGRCWPRGTERRRPATARSPARRFTYSAPRRWRELVRAQAGVRRLLEGRPGAGGGAERGPRPSRGPTQRASPPTRRLGRGRRPARPPRRPAPDDHPPGHHHQDLVDWVSRALDGPDVRVPPRIPWPRPRWPGARRSGRSPSGPVRLGPNELFGDGHRAGRRRRTGIADGGVPLRRCPRPHRGGADVGRAGPAVARAAGSAASGWTSTASGRRSAGPDLPRQHAQATRGHRRPRRHGRGARRPGWTRTSSSSACPRAATTPSRPASACIPGGRAPSTRA